MIYLVEVEFLSFICWRTKKNEGFETGLLQSEHKSSTKFWEQYQNYYIKHLAQGLDFST